jgi:hypothetical protein
MNNKTSSSSNNQDLSLCAICCEDITPITTTTTTSSSTTQSSHSATLIPCSHIYHTSCIEAWITASRHQTCPKCRGTFISWKNEFGIEHLLPEKTNSNDDDQTNNEEDWYEDEEADNYADVCLVCGKDENDDKALYCDECDQVFHTYCVGLKKVPRSENWYCTKCTLQRKREVLNVQQSANSSSSSSSSTTTTTTTTRKRPHTNKNNNIEHEHELSLQWKEYELAKKNSITPSSSSSSIQCMSYNLSQFIKSMERASKTPTRIREFLPELVSFVSCTLSTPSRDQRKSRVDDLLGSHGMFIERLVVWLNELSNDLHVRHVIYQQLNKLTPYLTVDQIKKSGLGKILLKEMTRTDSVRSLRKLAANVVSGFAQHVLLIPRDLIEQHTGTEDRNQHQPEQQERQFKRRRWIGRNV